jgi:hypothetical protein
VFYRDHSLRSVTFQDDSQLEEIQEGAFANCTGLSGIQLPDSVAILSQRSFSWLFRLAHVGLGAGIELQELPEKLFWRAESLLHVFIPSGIEEIGDQCFEGSCQLLEVSFDKYSVLSRIGARAFHQCFGLQTFTVPKSIRFLGEACFGDCTELTSVKFASETVLDASEPVLETSQSIRETSQSILETIGDYCWSGCCRLKSICVPPTVVHFGRACFAGCSALPKNPFCDHVMFDSIPSSSFQESGLQNFEVMGAICRLADFSFAECQFLQSVSFGQSGSVRVFGIGAFCRSNLKKMVFPDSLERLEFMCFQGCSELAEIVFGRDSHLKRIDKLCFQGCWQIRQVFLPSGLEFVGPLCFAGCSSLVIAAFSPNSQLRILSESAFAGCGTIALTVPAGLTSTPDAKFDRYGELIDLTDLSLPGEYFPDPHRFNRFGTGQ